MKWFIKKTLLCDFITKKIGRKKHSNTLLIRTLAWVKHWYFNFVACDRIWFLQEIFIFRNFNNGEFVLKIFHTFLFYVSVVRQGSASVGSSCATAAHTAPMGLTRTAAPDPLVLSWASSVPAAAAWAGPPSAMASLTAQAARMKRDAQEVDLSLTIIVNNF